MSVPLPYPWFGGKRRAASIIWQRLGQVDNYVEPFLGAGSIVLLRPVGAPHTVRETVNDKDGYVCNFWRSVQYDPEAVANAAERMTCEIEVNAWHGYLRDQRDAFALKLKENPYFFDAQIAGAWVHGIRLWIGSHYADAKGYRLPKMDGANRRLPLDLKRILGIHERVKRLRVMCGDWSRCVTDAVLDCGTYATVDKITGLVLDPPYNVGCEAYASGLGSEVYDKVVDWVLANYQNKRLRIALCGYEGMFTPPDGWQTVNWSTQGGYAATEAALDRIDAERVWFSPNCLIPETGTQEALF